MVTALWAVYYPSNNIEPDYYHLPEMNVAMSNETKDNDIMPSTKIWFSLYTFEFTEAYTLLRYKLFIYK